MSFMEQEYCRPAEAFKWPAPFFGYALCCGGVPPAVDFDPGDPNSAYGIGHIRCPKCGNQAGVIANSGYDNLFEKVGFLYKNWNRCFQPCKVNSGALIEPTIALPQGKEGYRWGELDIDYEYVGGKRGRRIHFVLFKTSHPDLLGKKASMECYINDWRCLNDLSILDSNGNEANLTWLLGRRNTAAHVSAPWCTDGTSWYCLNIRFYNTAQKHIIRFEQQMTRVGYSVCLSRDRENIYRY